MSNLEPLNDECNHCGDGILVDNFYDGAEYPCEECGGMNYWCVFDDDEAYLASGDTPLDRIQTLTASRDQWQADCVELAGALDYLRDAVSIESLCDALDDESAKELMASFDKAKAVLER
jgi:hypothetical protein